MNTTEIKGNDEQLPQAHFFEQEELRKLVRSFSNLFSSLTEEGVGSLVGEVYASDAYLNDTLKEVRGIEAIREYLIESGKAVQSCQVQINDLAQSQVDCYVRWTMEIRFKKLENGRICRSQGISHLRFNKNGKIIYHQDYWDSAGALFEHIPFLGLLIRQVKKRL